MTRLPATAPHAHFTDGSTSPVTDLHWSPLFVTGLAHRADGFARCVFIARDSTFHSDPWLDARRFTPLDRAGTAERRDGRGGC